MKDEEIDKAIAEHLGWRLMERVVDGDSNVYWLPPGQADYPESVFVFCDRMPPNYAGDLNACAEFEKTLVGHMICQYERPLCEITGTTGTGTRRSFVGERFKIATATARQRAEAFLRMVWKWKENE